MALLPAILPSIIGGITSIGQGLLGRKGQKDANQTNIQLAKEGREHDVNMWNKQNAYNTPEMQMQRLTEAGLNPHLMYGQGNTGNASAPQKAPVPEVQNELSSLSQMSLAPMISMYQDWRVKNAQIENLNANADATRQNASLTALRQLTQGYINQKHSIQLPWVDLQERNKTNIGSNKAEQENIKSRYLYNTLPEMTKQVMLRNNLLEQQTRHHQLENQFNQELKPYGMRSTDPLLMRLIMHVLPKTAIKNLTNQFTNKFKK